MRIAFQLPKPLSVAFLVVACASRLPAQPVATPVPELFEPTTLGPHQAVELEPYVVDSQAALVRLELLATISPQAKLELNLFPGRSFVAVVERVEKRADMRFTVAGRLEEQPLSSFIIVVEQDAVAAIIRAPMLSQVFSLRYVGDGVHLIQDIDSALIPPCDVGPLQAGGAPNRPEDNQEEAGAPPRWVEFDWQDSVCSPPAPVFDVMIVYTTLARNAAGGANTINARCQLAIEQANQGYENSLINARLRLVYRGEVNYSENGTMQDHLDRLTDPDDGIMDGVHPLRNTYWADFVSLWVTGPGGGLGWCVAEADEAFSVARWTNATNSFTFEHEIGHNQGCQHDRANADCTSAYSYSYGWRWIGNSGTQWRTIMAYPPGTRIQNFSNPDVLADGQPTGVPVGATNEAHNAQTINFRATTVEAFRTTRFDIWVDFAYGGTYQFGTFSNPFNNVAEGVANIITGVGASELPNLWIKAGATSETPTISTPMVIRACGGVVVIGQ